MSTASGVCPPCRTICSRPRGVSRAAEAAGIRPRTVRKWVIDIATENWRDYRIVHFGHIGCASRHLRLSPRRLRRQRWTADCPNSSTSISRGSVGQSHRRTTTWRNQSSPWHQLGIRPRLHRRRLRWVAFMQVMPIHNANAGPSRNAGAETLARAQPQHSSASALWPYHFHAPTPAHFHGG